MVVPARFFGDTPAIGLQHHFTPEMSVRPLVGVGFEWETSEHPDTSESPVGLGLAVGVQHMFTNAFGLYADTGLRFTYDSDNDTSALEIATRTSNLGVIVYLN